MRTSRTRAALTGLAAGALLTALLLGASQLAARAGLPSIPYSWFELITRVLPGRLVIFGLEHTLGVLEGLGFDIKNTGKTAEEVQAITGLLAAGAAAGLLFFALTRAADRRRVVIEGLALGAALGAATVVVIIVEPPDETLADGFTGAVWVLALSLLWGWALARLRLATEPAAPRDEIAGAGAADVSAAPAPPGPPASTYARAEAAVIDRRHFLIRVGGAAATIVVLGAELSDILQAQSAPAATVAVPPIAFPNAGSPVKPVPGTRLEYTAPVDHYRVDIDIAPPQIDAASWRLHIDGLVDHPQELTLDQLKSRYRSLDQFITLECISNPVGGPLIGTTLWTGPSFRDVLAPAGPQPAARYAHVISADGFDEVVDLATIQSDHRVLLAHSWNGRPLPVEHGFPLRVYVPDVHGMKQPKWITDVVLVADSIAGYWVKRGWDKTAEVHTTSVIDVVATRDLVIRRGQTLVPVGGIAYAGDRGISRVEVQADGGAWEPAELRQPLSQLTWVIWRYEWPFSKGRHVFAVRAYDGAGQLQVTQAHGTFPSGATGVDTKTANV